MDQMFKDEKYFQPKGSYFGPIIDIHDKYDWTKLRKFFAGNADFLTDHIMSFPKSKTPPLFRFMKNSIKDIFAYTGETDKTIFEKDYKSDVFDPWANWWCGKWSHGITQYHIWDKTIGRAGKYLQAVTQTIEASPGLGFADSSTIEAMVLNNQVNMAINVATKEYGITGWVTKTKSKDGKAVTDKSGNAVLIQMPHIGYLIKRKMLIWLAIERSESNLNDFNGRWYMFLERTNKASDATRYYIYLKSFVVVTGSIDKSAKVFTGCAGYHNHTPGDGIAHCDEYTCVP
jgi:hypothetical protein